MKETARTQRSIGALAAGLLCLTLLPACTSVQRTASVSLPIRPVEGRIDVPIEGDSSVSENVPTVGPTVRLVQFESGH